MKYKYSINPYIYFFLFFASQKDFLKKSQMCGICNMINPLHDWVADFLNLPRGKYLCRNYQMDVLTDMIFTPDVQPCRTHCLEMFLRQRIVDFDTRVTSLRQEFGMNGEIYSTNRDYYNYRTW